MQERRGYQVTALSMATAMFYIMKYKRKNSPFPSFPKACSSSSHMKNLIKTERARQNLTQAELAEKAKHEHLRATITLLSCDGIYLFR